MKRIIRTYLSWQILKPEGLASNKTIIFIDLFFSSTNLITSFSAGIRAAYLAYDFESFVLLCNTHKNRALCATEPGLFEKNIAQNPSLRDSIFNISTPLAMSGQIKDSEILVLWSSNGTPGIIAMGQHANTMVGAMANIDSLTSHILNNTDSDEILFVCAGSKNKTSIEDLWCAGAYLKSFFDKVGQDQFTIDYNSKVALQLYLQSHPSDIAKKSLVAQLAISRGQSKEVLFCMKKNTSNNILIFDGINQIKLI